MELGKYRKVGTYFKKENIFLATVLVNNATTKEMLKSSKKQGTNIEVPEGLMELAVDSGFVFAEQYDVFYKDDKGYTRFVEEGPESFIGDNSDGKGFVKNVVSIWEYYSEEQVVEFMVNNEFMAIGVLDSEPIYRYNNDYNKI